MCVAKFRFFYHGAANLLSDRIAKLTNPSLKIEDKLNEHYHNGIIETTKQMSDYLDLASTSAMIKFGTANTFDSLYKALRQEPFNTADDTHGKDIKDIREEYKTLLDRVRDWSIGNNVNSIEFPLNEDEKLRLDNFLKKVVITEARLSDKYHGRN